MQELLHPQRVLPLRLLEAPWLQLPGAVLLLLLRVAAGVMQHQKRAPPLRLPGGARELPPPGCAVRVRVRVLLPAAAALPLQAPPLMEREHAELKKSPARQRRMLAQQRR